MNEPKISVIVPVYNTEKYIRKCMDSLVNQTLEGVEVVVVNDGSTDGCRDILEEYKENLQSRINGIKQREAKMEKFFKERNK